MLLVVSFLFLDGHHESDDEDSYIDKLFGKGVQCLNKLGLTAAVLQFSSSLGLLGFGRLKNAV